MNGAESIIQSARSCGIDVCFANPGTTEIPLVAALDAVGESGRSCACSRGCAPVQRTGMHG